MKQREVCISVSGIRTPLRLLSRGSRRLDTAYLQTTVTPTGMQSAKLGQVTKYLRMIGKHELSTRDRLTDTKIALLRSG